MKVTVVEGPKCDSSGCTLNQCSIGNYSLCFDLGADVPSPHQKPPALSVLALGPPQRQLKGEKPARVCFNPQLAALV